MSLNQIGGYLCGIRASNALCRGHRGPLLYDAARLERAISAITYVVSECRAELEAHCAQTGFGEGRVAQGLNDHASELSPGCDQALTDIGAK